MGMGLAGYSGPVIAIEITDLDAIFIDLPLAATDYLMDYHKIWKILIYEFLIT